jgi:chromosome partitioning protein
MLKPVEPPLNAKPLPRPRVTLEDVSTIGAQTTHVMDQMKSMAYMPNTGKVAPSYNATQLSKLCGVSGSAMLRALERAEEEQMPAGVAVEGGKRAFPVADARAWVRKLSESYVKRSPGTKGATIAIANFKGGVGKTTITVNLAQGLSLKGYRVLVIDLDPQGSATSMLGHTPLAIETEQTFLPLASGERESIRESVIQTYWDGVDLVAGNTGLHSAEFYLPARVIEAQRNGEVFNFEEVLNKGLDSVRDEYDFILVDNPPQLGYSTLNALWAADAVMMPIVPEGLSVMSSSQFWTMFEELAVGVVSLGGRAKEWAWVGVLPSMMENKSQYQVMMQYIRSAYGNTVMRSEVPSTAVIEVGGTRLKTVYDFGKYVGDSKTYARARDAFDDLAYEVEQLTRETVWGLVPIATNERSAA